MPDAQRTFRASVFRSGTGPRLYPATWLMVLSLMLFMTSVGSAIMHAQAAGTRGRTVWDGVYTDAQAARATATFDQSCSGCHTLTSQGEGPLAGGSFWSGYSQKTVGDLLTFVKTNMPDGAGGSLPAASYNDLVALILKSNGFPAGTAELAPETVASVQIVPKDGGVELPDNTLVRVVGCLARTGTEWVLTNATAPERADKIGVTPADAGRPLGNRTITLKFVLTRLDAFAGKRMSASGLLMGEGGVDGLNVSTVNRVAETCP